VNKKKVKILIGGSPCTFWSIAQKNHREVEAEGMGWELFKNYLIAKEKFQPDFFLYENNKSAATAIKEQISRELGVGLMHINSALVSAQNRQRFYAFNWEVEQPEDRGLLLADILESGTNLTDGDKSYCLTTRCMGAIPEDTIKKHRHTMIAEKQPPVGVGYRNRREDDGKLYRRFETHGKEKSNAITTVQTDSMVATPIRVGHFNKGGQGDRIYSQDGKSICLAANSGGMGSNTGLYAIEVGGIISENTGECKTVQKAIPDIVNKIGYIPEMFNAYNRQEITEKSPTLSTGSMVTSSCAVNKFELVTNDNKQQIYEVSNGKIEIQGKKYPIKLADGSYIIRKLSPVECERLQTMPDNYTEGVSNSQRYKALGNGWTAEVIIHILQGALGDLPRDTEIEVLSMYDGIATGRYCLEKMGFTNVTYHAYEIDKYAIQIAMKNYPDIIQHGDAFQVRDDAWNLNDVGK
jgi:DNA (cytosine-5)-methyltransferase 3A